MDDMGWRDLACYGSTFYNTPNIDLMAQNSMQFTQAYAACPVCSPSRASLLTGRYPARLGITNYIHDGEGARGKLLDAPFIRELRVSETTYATLLREAGYKTWHVGKWHLGGEAYWPTSHGFDVNVGGCALGHPVHGYFSPYNIPTLSDGPPGEYLTDRLTNEAILLIDEHAAADSSAPFLLNLWHYAVHTPIQAPQELVDKYRDRANELGLSETSPFVEGEPFPAEHKRHLRVTRRILQSDPAYAAMIENLDTNVGRLAAHIQAVRSLENLVIIFTSDNGGLSTAEGSPTCNLPLAEGKGWMYEGGTREPLIVFAPGRAKAGVCDVPVMGTDIFPTLLDLAGIPLRPELHCDGVSLLPLLEGRASQMYEERPIFWHYPHYGNQGGTPAASVRRGDWKLIWFFENSQAELYNLRTDAGERRDMLNQEPAIASELKSLLFHWQQTMNARYPEVNTSPLILDSSHTSAPERG